MWGPAVRWSLEEMGPPDNLPSLFYGIVPHANQPGFRVLLNPLSLNPRLVNSQVYNVFSKICKEPL